MTTPNTLTMDDPSHRPERFFPGFVISDRYRIEQRIARGGMGVVFLATQLALMRKVAIKVLNNRTHDIKLQRRFLLEASTCARLAHRHVVTVHDYGASDEGDLYMVMEFLDGEPLSSLIERRQRLPADLACRLGLQIGRALRSAHALGIIHRDLKPSNVMVLRDEREEGTEFIKVLDFGLAKVFETEHGPKPLSDSMNRSILGSPRFMSPEQIRADTVDARTDIYSFGAMLFKMVSGRPPFDGAGTIEILNQHLKAPVPSLRDVIDRESYVPELDVLVQRCLAKSPSDRYSAMQEVTDDLKAVLRLMSAGSELRSGLVDDPLETSNLPTPIKKPPPSKRIYVIAAAAAAAALVVPWLLMRGGPPASVPASVPEPLAPKADVAQMAPVEKPEQAEKVVVIEPPPAAHAPPAPHAPPVSAPPPSRVGKKTPRRKPAIKAQPAPQPSPQLAPIEEKIEAPRKKLQTVDDRFVPLE